MSYRFVVRSVNHAYHISDTVTDTVVAEAGGRDEARQLARVMNLGNDRSQPIYTQHAVLAPVELTF